MYPNPGTDSKVLSRIVRDSLVYCQGRRQPERDVVINTFGF